MEKVKDKQAFPYDDLTQLPGMTLEDWFAGQAMKAFISTQAFRDETIPERAYQMARRMLEHKGND